MNSPRFTIGIALIAALALPASASAHSKATSDSVRTHIRSADAALEKVSTLVAANEDAAAAVAAARNRAQTKQADREARKLRKASDRATALRRVAEQHDENLETYTEVVDEIAGAAQVDAAKAIVGSLTGRERALETLTKLAPTLPAQAQMGIAKAIAALSSGGTEEFVELATAVSSGDIAPQAQSYLQTAMGKAAAGITRGMERLQGLVGMLPAQAQGPVQAAMDRVNGILQGLLAGRVPAPSTATTSGLPIPTSLIASLPIPSGLPLPGFLAGN